ncbi:proline-rich receptor-like protein kinase PERK4 [Dioscorea cayenensis subsp. rotundata]|uniref:non-specific serine/threonine protein kinase n=1 Tax=Dioscorea cayennensis subsp. rotundata TaxID=55577 RepID=A0AB40CM70_DIOCR|nr:proline-rich receptor-like protein kinase PERK4 [Dioscorea cayenensis subsp. rotundata]
MQYYADSGTKGEESGYYSSTIEPQWKQGKSEDLSSSSISINPPPRWQPQPPPLIPESDSISSTSSPHGPPLPPPYPTITLGFNKISFTYEELSVATNGFSKSNLLGKGGFGYVHKGVLPSGKEIAVKQLKSGSGQGEREFQAEVDIISRVHHRHLVSLVGFCIAGSQRMLIYEFVPNKTLAYHLHGKGLPTMDWSTRLKVALGTAKGLAYLHEDCHPRIIHRDIKSANILLDANFEAMVADFGLAKLTSDNNTHVSTRVMGTLGYLAPEYASSGKLTEKSDVFSFGVMLLELITGRRPVDNGHKFMDEGLVDWARQVMSRAMVDGNYDELVDSRLEGKYNPVELARMVGCAAASIRHSAKRRPKMSQILRALEGDVSLEDLNEGVRPGQSMLFSSGSDYESSPKTSNMNRFRKASLTSPEFSGEFNSPKEGRNVMNQYQAAIDYFQKPKK